MYRGKLWTMRAVRRLRHRRRVQPPLPVSARAGRKRACRVAFDLPTQMGCDSDHRDGARRGRTGRRRDRLARGHARRCSTASRSTEVSTSMTINATAAIAARALPRRRRRSRALPSHELSRHDPERHPQGVHRARHVHLSAAAIDAHRSPTSFAYCAREVPQLEHDLDLRAITSARPARPRRRRSRSRWPTALPTSTPRCGAGLDVDRLWLSGCRSSSTPHNDLLEGDREVPRRPASVGADHAGAVRMHASSSLVQLRFHAQTAGCDARPRSSPTNNIVRRYAAGARPPCWAARRACTTNWRDEALALPDRGGGDASRLRTQQIIAARVGRRRHGRPAGGQLRQSKD